MNLYFLVEGERTEKKVYRSWIQYVFPHLSEVFKVEDVLSNHFFMVAGKGYPSYKSRVLEALINISRHDRIDHFIICIDAEEESVDSKEREIK